MSNDITISANFRTGAVLPTIESQYHDLWRFAKHLQTEGLPLDSWFPPAATEEASLANKAFTDTGPSTAALAMANADADNHATDLRSLGVWNGKERPGGAAYTLMYKTGRFPSNLDFTCKDIAEFRDHRTVMRIVQSVVSMWNPMLVQVGPGKYFGKKVFPDRPPAGWMIYLPFPIRAEQVPEAAQVVPLIDTQGKRQAGTLLVTVTEPFDVDNPEHVRRANAIETRLVDQDLLPTLREFVARF